MTRWPAALAALVVVAPAAASDVVPKLPSALPRVEESPYLLPPKKGEINVVATLLTDWNGRVDRPAYAGISRTSVMVGVEGMLGNERFRIGPSFGVQAFRWGDDRHGPLSIVPGMRLRSSPVVDDLVEIYVVGRVDLPISMPVADGILGVALRPAVGMGVRALRAVAIEVTFDPVFAIGDTRFESTSNDRWAPGVGVALSFNPCVFGCEAVKPKPKHRDLACRLYARAKAAGEYPAGTCAAVRRAIDAVPDPLAPPICPDLAEVDEKRLEDGTSAFLQKLEVEAPAEAKVRVHGLSRAHCELLEALWRYDRSRRAHELTSQKLAESWSYAPTPVELREFLGCKPDGEKLENFPTACEELKDEKP